MVVGITGLPGSGKSALCRAMKGRGYPVAYTDELAREERSMPKTCKAMRDAFPEQHTNGVLDPAALAKLIFSDEAARRRAEEIIHPAVKSRLARWLCSVESRVAIIECAILHEANFSAQCDKAVYVYSPDEIRMERLRARGWSPEDIAARESCQMPSQTKISMSDYVVNNTATVDFMADALEEAIAGWLEKSI